MTVAGVGGNTRRVRYKNMGRLSVQNKSIRAVQRFIGHCYGGHWADDIGFLVFLGGGIYDGLRIL